MKAGPGLKALGTLLLLFACCYGPAFGVVVVARPPLAIAVPMIIGVSFVVAMALTAMFARKPDGFEEFGFRPCAPRYLVIAVTIAVPLGWLLDFLVARYTSATSMPEMALPLSLKLLYFVVGAAIQEEIIFRGLLQTMFARWIPQTFLIRHVELAPAVLVVALLFGVIHLEVDIMTAAAAFVLGVVAGELRRRSSSLLPAIIVHAIFNGFSM